MDPERLRTIPIFAALQGETLRCIATFATETSVPAGKHLVKEGDYAYEFMAIEQGEADVVRDGEHVATLGPGEVFGEVGVLEQTLRAASVVATTPVRLVTLSRWDLARAEGALDEIRVALQGRRPLGSSPT